MSGTTPGIRTITTGRTSGAVATTRIATKRSLTGSKELVAFRDFALAQQQAGNPGGKMDCRSTLLYKEQAEELKKRCQKIFLMEIRLTNKIRETISFCAGSVGRAFKAMKQTSSFELCESAPTNLLLSEAPNRYNVAITRARYMMVHVGNWTAMSKGARALGRIVHKLEYAKHSTSAMELNHENRH